MDAQAGLRLCCEQVTKSYLVSRAKAHNLMVMLMASAWLRACCMCKAFHRRITTFCLTNFDLEMPTGVSLLRTTWSKYKTLASVLFLGSADAPCFCLLFKVSTIMH